ncbi:MAG: alpha/beta fold hydrolase [Acidothermus sp.]|nr:alpha/beta fold hydrolase [Acidothermus sp.]
MRIQVDYDEMRRLAAVWSTAAWSLGEQVVGLAVTAADPAIVVAAPFDPWGAARVEATLTRAGGRLARLAATLTADAAALRAVVAREELADFLPDIELRDLLPSYFFDPRAIWHRIDPRAIWRRVNPHAIGRAVEARVGIVAAHLEDVLGLVAPSARFRTDISARRPARVDPIFGLPLRSEAKLLPDGPGAVQRCVDVPPWGATPPATPAEMLRRVGELEGYSDAVLAVQRVRSPDGAARYVVYLPGMRAFGPTPTPQDLPDAVRSLETGSSSYTRCVVQALDRLGVPQGAPVLLVGHSEGGIVAADLAADRRFNGGRVRVTHVLAAGSPISGTSALAGTTVFSVENDADVVVHLDGLQGPGPGSAQVVYRYFDNERSVVRNHEVAGYVRHLEGLADSPNPRWRRFVAETAPYRFGESETIVFRLRDDPSALPSSTGSCASR